MFVTPEYVFKDVTHITPEWLAAKGIRALVRILITRSRPTAARICPTKWPGGWLR